MEEDVPEVAFSGTWKIESLTITNEGGEDITSLFRLANLSGASIFMDVGNTYYIEDQNPVRNNKVFPFLFFVDPEYYVNGHTRAFGTWEVLESGDLLFERGSDEYFTRVIEADKDHLVLLTFTDLDYLGNGYDFFFLQGKNAGREKASTASGQSSYNDGFTMGTTYGFLKGYNERYDELYNSSQDPTNYYIVSDPLNANAIGFIESIDQDFTNVAPAFNLGFTDAYSGARTTGRNLATNNFNTSGTIGELRKNFRLRYTLTRPD
jgi:hypothetical protein